VILEDFPTSMDGLRVQPIAGVVLIYYRLWGASVSDIYTAFPLANIGVFRYH
jgi:hypothetical protein